MKINIVLTLIAVLLGALIGYAFYAAGASLMVTIGGGVLCTLFLAGGMGLSYERYPRTSMLLKITSICAFLLMLVLNIICGVLDAGTAPYVITNGLITLLFVTILYLLCRSKQ